MLYKGLSNSKMIVVATLILCLQVCYTVSQNISTQSEEENQSGADSSVVGILPTDGFCWTQRRGKFCFEKDAFQSVSMMGDELFYEEFLDGKKYSYSMQNTKKLEDDFSTHVPKIVHNKKLSHAISDTSWLESNDGVKYRCKVQDLEYFHFDASDNHILEMNGDGSSTWSFGDWVINVDSKMIPISLRSNHEDQLVASIQGVEKMSSKIVGCDPDKEANQSPEISSKVHERFLKILDAHDPSVSEDEFFSAKGSTRRLDWVTDLQGYISNTQWCGAGTDNFQTPCPDKDLSYDFFADQACRRHDHGAKYEKTWIGVVPRLECYVDKQLLDAGGHNWAVEAAYAEWGGTSVIGCYNYEAYDCWYWRGWSLRYGYCGHVWDINYGYWRYDNAVKKSGYLSRPQSCPYDYMLDW